MPKTKLTVDTLSLRKVAEAIGVKVQQLSLESKRRGFPSHKIKGKRLYRVAEVVAWRAKNIRVRTTREDTDVNGGKLTEAQPKPKGRALASEEDPFIVAMMSGNADGLSISRASMQMASRMVAQGAVDGTLSGMELDGLKKTLAELRAAEADYLKMATERRDLLERADVEALVCVCVSRLVRCLSVVESTIATEFEVWLCDEKVRTMSTDDRKRMVRDWVARTCSAVRQQEADDIRKLIDQPADGDGPEEEA